jgi:hypothetical protein
LGQEKNREKGQQKYIQETDKSQGHGLTLLICIRHSAESPLKRTANQIPIHPKL